MFASKPFDDTVSRTTQSRLSIGQSFLSRISRVSTHSNEAKPKDHRQSGKMLALTFEDDSNMQTYLQKSFSFARRQVQVSEMEEICV